MGDLYYRKQRHFLVYPLKGAIVTYSPNFRGSAARAASRQLQTNFQNGTVSTLAQNTVVSANASGQAIPLIPSDENLVKSLLGITGISIPSAASGAVINGGRLEEISGSFALNDPIYVALDGSLTNVKPDYGVGGFDVGDFVIFVGIVVKNEFNVSLKDIQLFLSVVGQL